MPEENNENGKEEKIEKELEHEDEKELEKESIDESGRKIIGAEITQEMEKAYIDYAMSVIVSRALPCVEDGLKPVHRRILYAMNEMGLWSNKQTVKSARIVGNVLGHYHPHGDIAIYDALVRMAQDFSLRYPLVIGQGNWGSLDGDSPAAMRYTECKLSPISMELLDDIDKDTVNMIPNFDNSMKEPELLPGKLPNLLLNGATGIAVGMATNIPPHNLTELCDGIIALINKPEITIEKLAEIIQGPDFPTGGYVNASGIMEMYKTGKGQLIIRGKNIIEEERGRENIIITEIPYMVNKADLVKEIAKLVTDKKLPDISDLRDESSKGKVRIVIELRRGADSKYTLNRLYQYTRLQDRFDANILALVKGRPMTLNLKQILGYYVEYRKLVITRRSKFELKEAQDRLEIVKGLLIALKDVDNIIFAIKKSANSTEALENLIKKFNLSKRQAQAILDMRFAVLTALETEKLKKEQEELKIGIAELEKILGDVQEILSIIKKEVSEIKRKYGDNRRTYILQRVSEISEKDLVQKKDVVITITAKGYAKRIDIKAYREQKRGGKGVIGADLATGDFVKQMIICNTHDYLLFFTASGKCYWLKAYETPEVARYGKGKALINLLNINEEITAILSVKNFSDFLFMVTKKGIVKKMPLAAFSKPRKAGVRAIKLKDDRLISIELLKNENVMLATAKGMAVRFSSEEVREMGKNAYGVTGIKLAQGDEVIGMKVLKGESILTLTENGFGKRTAEKEYRKTARACKGIINIKTSQRNGKVIGIETAKKEDSIIVTTAKGMVIRTSAKEIREMSRATQGVRIIKLQQGDKASSLVKVESINI